MDEVNALSKETSDALQTLTDKGFKVIAVPRGRGRPRKDGRIIPPQQNLPRRQKNLIRIKGDIISIKGLRSAGPNQVGYYIERGHLFEICYDDEDQPQDLGRIERAGVTVMDLLLPGDYMQFGKDLVLVTKTGLQDRTPDCVWFPTERLMIRHKI